MMNMRITIAAIILLTASIAHADPPPEWRSLRWKATSVGELALTVQFPAKSSSKCKFARCELFYESSVYRMRVTVQVPAASLMELAAADVSTLAKHKCKPTVMNDKKSVVFVTCARDAVAIVYIASNDIVLTVMVMDATVRPSATDIIEHILEVPSTAPIPIS
jgi:hypothetical protein